MIWQKIGKYLVSAKFLNYFLSKFLLLPTAIYGKKGMFPIKNKINICSVFHFSSAARTITQDIGWMCEKLEGGIRGGSGQFLSFWVRL